MKKKRLEVPSSFHGLETVGVRIHSGRILMYRLHPTKGWRCKKLTPRECVAYEKKFGKEAVMTPIRTQLQLKAMKKEAEEIAYQNRIKALLSQAGIANPIVDEVNKGA